MLNWNARGKKFPPCKLHVYEECDIRIKRNMVENIWSLHQTRHTQSFMSLGASGTGSVELFGWGNNSNHRNMINRFSNVQMLAHFQNASTRPLNDPKKLNHDLSYKTSLKQSQPKPFLFNEVPAYPVWHSKKGTGQGPWSTGGVHRDHQVENSTTVDSWTRGSPPGPGWSGVSEEMEEKHVINWTEYIFCCYLSFNFLHTDM